MIAVYFKPQFRLGWTADVSTAQDKWGTSGYFDGHVVHVSCLTAASLRRRPQPECARYRYKVHPSSLRENIDTGAALDHPFGLRTILASDRRDDGRSGDGRPFSWLLTLAPPSHLRASRWRPPIATTFLPIGPNGPCGSLSSRRRLRTTRRAQDEVAALRSRSRGGGEKVRLFSPRRSMLPAPASRPSKASNRAGPLANLAARHRSDLMQDAAKASLQRWGARRLTYDDDVAAQLARRPACLAAHDFVMEGGAATTMARHVRPPAIACSIQPNPRTHSSAEAVWPRRWGAQLLCLGTRPGARPYRWPGGYLARRRAGVVSFPGAFGRGIPTPSSTMHLQRLPDDDARGATLRSSGCRRRAGLKAQRPDRPRQNS